MHHMNLSSNLSLFKTIIDREVGGPPPPLLCEPSMPIRNVNWCLMTHESGSTDHGAAIIIAGPE
jgi:hypothetical protein